MQLRYLALTAALTLSAGMLMASCKTADPGKTTNGAYASPVPSDGTKTLKNLQTAFDDETNAEAKYVQYALKADEEGYPKAGSLFRAAARSEQIHGADLAGVIRQMGGTPQAESKAPVVRSTRENLEEAAKSEAREGNEMYAGFMLEARSTGNLEAMRAFNFAKTSEGEHYKLYQKAAADLESLKSGKDGFHLCPRCGYMMKDRKFDKCPVDSTPSDKFELID